MNTIAPSYYETITTSQDMITRINYARSDSERRRRKRSAYIVNSVIGLGYWSHGNPEVLSELADDLANALLDMIKNARSAYNVGYLIKGIERKMFAPPEAEDYKPSTAVIKKRVTRFEQHDAWTRIGEVRSFDYEPGWMGVEEPEEDDYDGYDASTIAEFEAALPQYDAEALMEFGAAIATYGWRHDPHDHGLGSPLMVALIAYLRAFEPARDPVNQ